MNDKAIAIVVGGAGRGAPEVESEAESVSLTFADRALARQTLVSSSGRQITVALAEAGRVRPGDALTLASGGQLAVVAAAEDVVVVTGPNLLQVVWQIGNRHAPCQIGAEQVVILPEPALEAALRASGAILTPMRASFVPDCLSPIAGAGLSVHHHGASHAKGAAHDEDDDDPHHGEAAAKG